ncbi:hypothetical protein [Micromonospora sp. WMMD812]|uniref:hypothetical protein n=1 Tax=Micromonospora sp. WMMD812 TaxID=3015152 RepID=UPI00248D236C|nr:hypothetical protein [Micromonospora sp. WMMD812]WBB69349.1 hypothetical protein O7603_08365 [Micromonospora sp. WMMD812]
MQEDRRHLRLSLADLDVLGSDAALRAQAEQAARAAESRPTPTVYTGLDRTGAVAVRVDATSDVEDVAVERDWRRRVDVDGVAGAIFEAYAGALRAAVEATALREVARDQEVAAPSTPEPRAAVEDELDDHVWLRRTWRTLHDIDADLDRLAHARDDRAEHAIAGPHGFLTLRLRGDSITAITGDTDRIARLDAGQLESEALSLFRSYALARRGTDPEEPA